jgi:hypothetical protein
MKTRLIVACVLVGVLVLMVAVVLLVGSQLPAKHVASRSTVIQQTPESVYAVVRDFKSTPAWRAGVTQVELTTLPNGNVGFRETGSQGTVSYEIAEDVVGQRIVTRIIDTDLGYSGSWTYVFTNEGGGTRVTITENGEVSNLLFRFMSRFIFGHTATMDQYLQDLAKRMG